MTDKSTQEYTIEDLMDRSKEIEEVCSIVRELPSNDHTCIAIDGNWGCGKTHVLNILQKKFESDKNNIVIKYDAWENNFYDDPLITILFCVLDALKTQVKNDKMLKKVVKATLKEAKKNWDGVKNSFWDKAVQTGADSTNFKIAVVCCLIEMFINIGKEASKTLLDDAQFSAFRSYQSLLNDSKQILNALTKNGNKIILLVDEVDRCLPDEQLRILERLHHLFQIHNGVVIVALNKESIVEAYITQYCYKDSSLGQSYLKKFFEHNVKLDDKEYVLFNAYLTDFINKNFVHEEERAKKCVSDIYAIILAIGNKSASKKKLDARNIVAYRKQLERILGDRLKQDKMDYLEAWFTIIMLYCKMFSPGFINYEEYKSGRSPQSSYIDIKDDLIKDLETSVSVSYTLNNGMDKYNRYRDGSFNRYQHLLNYSLFRHSNTRVLANLGSIAQINDTYPWIDNVFALIDRYAVCYGL